jgi:hypothetical protein
MLRHVVLFRWREGTTADQVEAVRAGAAALPARIPELVRYTVGADAGLVEGNWDFAVVADLEDADAYRRYADHPAHQALIAERIRPILAARAAVQFEAVDLVGERSDPAAGAPAS